MSDDVMESGVICDNSSEALVGTFEPGITSREGGHVYEEVSGTLRANPGDNQMTVYGFGEAGIGYWQEGIQTLRAEGENRPSRPSNVVVYGADMYNQDIYEEVEPTIGVNCGISTGRNGVVIKDE